MMEGDKYRYAWSVKSKGVPIVDPWEAAGRIIGSLLAFLFIIGLYASVIMWAFTMTWPQALVLGLFAKGVTNRCRCDD